MIESELEAVAEDRISRYLNDWVLFATEVLGCMLDDEQAEILRAVQTNKLVSVASGTARGKDFVAAVAALCFLYLTPKWDNDGNLIENTKVAMTAPTGRQVGNIMLPEVTRLYNRAIRNGVDLPGRLVANDIRTENEEWFLTGFKADEHNHEAWSGFHAVNTMFVVTEASGISDDTFGAIEGNLQGNSRLLLVFNPNTPVGYAARSQKGGRWKKFRLNSLTAPNVIQKKNIIPGQVDYDWVKDKITNWCTPIQKSDVREDEDDFEFDGKWYRPEDLFRIKVLGKFPKVPEDVLIPMQWIEAANERWKKHSGVARDGLVLGVDVAGMGRDSTVYCNRFNNYVSIFDKEHSGGRANHMAVAGKIKFKLDSIQAAIASIDTIGEGAGVYSKLVEDGLEERVISCKFSESAENLKDVTGQYQFANMRAYLFWAIRDWLDPKNNTGAMLPPDDEFLEEATEIKWLFRSNGSIIIEPKEDIKKRLGRSTDKFDALANTFYPIRKFKPKDITGYFF